MFWEADSQFWSAFLQDLSEQTMLCKLFLLVSATTLALQAASLHNAPTVHVQQGTLTGTYFTSRYGRKFAAFQGIPYAQPPIGDLRFKVRVIYLKISKRYCCTFKCKIHIKVSNTVLFLISYNVRRTSSTQPDAPIYRVQFCPLYIFYTKEFPAVLLCARDQYIKQSFLYNYRTP